MDIRCDDCRALHWIGERVANTTGENSRFTSCCNQGDIQLEQFRDPPDFLRDLLTGENPRARDFRKSIRRFNNAFAFTSIDCTQTDRGARGNGPNCFQIHGALYHVTGPIEPVTGQQPKFAQLYLYDPQAATDLRYGLFDGLDRQFIQDFTNFIYCNNPFPRIYKFAGERLREAELRSSPTDMQVVLNPQMRLIMERGADRRRENLPTADEVAAIIPDEYESNGPRDVVLARRTSLGLQPAFSRIPATHASYMPLAYPLLFPYGTSGFHYNMRLRDNRNFGRQRNNISIRQYYRYQLFPRSRTGLIPFAFGRLFQQFLVDAWATCDQVKLSWLRNNQSTLRADLYVGVTDALSRNDVDVSQIGHRTILPATYVGGPRFIAGCYQDSMAIVRYFGHPALFVTLTANPKWPEILRELLPGQQATDRPDVVARVFRLKSKEFLTEIKQGNIFGLCVADVYTIEYQKRGLPHMHLLVFLSPEFRNQLLEPAIIDRLISAELPTPDTDPDGQLTVIIQSNMLHGPCGTDNPNAPCMVSGCCSKKFPKSFSEETVVQADGYPVYRRRNNGQTFVKRCNGREVVMDNRWVVPHSPYLSRKYACHINVEICASVKSIKYIHKYVYKGSDQTTAVIGENRQPSEHDEIGKHLNGRYIGPSEAAWQLFEYPVHEEYPPVTHLHVHLPGHHTVSFPGDSTASDVNEHIERQESTLMAFFRYNLEHPQDTVAQDLLYQDFPTKYTFNKGTRRWTKRKTNTKAIGRMFFVPPAAGERYFLRLLLTVAKGPKSFEDLRTTSGVLHPTFQAACIARGLLADDRDWIICFEEAVVWQTGKQLRVLFSTALVFGCVSNPKALWERFCTNICDDLTYRIQQMGEVGIPPEIDNPHLDYGLYLLQKLLTHHGKCLSDFGMPEPIHDWDRSGGNPLLTAELAYDMSAEEASRDDVLLQFNDDQRNHFDEIVTAVSQDPRSAHFFIQGAGGTGKTFLYRGLCHYFRSLGRIVLCVASSGIAALLLPGGTTAHSRFRIPLDLHPDSVCNVSKNSQVAELFRQTELVIWDEVPMQHKHCFEAVHRMLTDVRGDDSFFGGIPTVFGGDFAQILPVVKHGNRAAIVSANLQNSFLWQQMRVLKLWRNMRVHNDEPNRAFAEWLRNLSYDRRLHGQIPLFPGIGQFKRTEDLYSWIYPPDLLQSAVNDHTAFRSTAILTARNDVVTEINDNLLDAMLGNEQIYNSVDTAEFANEGEGYGEMPAVEVLNSFQPASLPLSRLRLKIGAPIMLLRNLAPREGLCNGTRLSIVRLGRRCIQARILGGLLDGELRLIPRIKLNSSDDELPYIISRIQFPVRLCFAMTINKAQGQSFKRVGVDLRIPVFTHGQFYVAMSRATDVNRLAVLLPGDERSGKVLNIVYPEVLLD